MNDLEIMKSYCDKCKHKGTCHMICPTVWFAVLQNERTERRTVLGSETEYAYCQEGRHKMIELVNKEDAQGPSIMEMARDIKDICTGIDYAECSTECECFDKDTGACRLYGNDPSDWDI